VSRPASAPVFALALGILAVSWGAILVRFCRAPSLVIASYRLAFATAILLPAALISRVPAFPERGKGRTLALILLAGLFLALHFGAWIASLAYTSVASSVVLVATQPLFSACLSGPVLGEKAPPRLYLGVLLALAGTGVIAGGDLGLSALHLRGDLLALLGAAAAAGYLMVGRRVGHGAGFVPYLTLVTGCSALFLGVAAWTSGERLLPALRGDLPWYLLMAAGPSVVGHGCFNWAVRRLEVFYVNLAAFGEPILASGYAYLLLGESPRASIWAGSGLVLAGVLVALPRRGRSGEGSGAT
jgi:drug/metabolite transporter (DMT)-like permease